MFYTQKSSSNRELKLQATARAALGGARGFDLAFSSAGVGTPANDFPEDDEYDEDDGDDDLDVDYEDVHTDMFII
eukprot:1359004-Amorphochlora_amoeboformis.AAC.1